MPSTKLDAKYVLLAYCQEGKAKTDYYDTTVTGFVLEVRPSGGKTYALRYRNPYGKQCQYKIGNAADLPFDKAKKEAQRLRGLIALGQDPGADRTTTRSIMTVEELSVIYLEHARGRKKSHAIDERYTRNHIVPRFGKHRLDEVKQQDVVAWLTAKWQQEGYAKATVNRLQVVLGCMYKLAKRSNLPGSDINPVAGVSLLNPDNERERFLSVQEVRRLKAEVDASESTQLKYIVGLLLLTGARKRELLDAKWEDMDLEARRWRIPINKSGRPRSVPLPLAAVAMIKALPKWEGCPYLLPNPATKKPFISVYNSWDTARRAAGLPDVRMHDLRHSAASNMVNSGQTLYAVAKVLGHRQTRTTERYAHLSQAALLDTVDAGANYMGTDWS